MVQVVGKTHLRTAAALLGLAEAYILRGLPALPHIKALYCQSGLPIPPSWPLT